MNIAICDDNVCGIKYLASYLVKHCEKYYLQYKIVLYKNGEELLKAYTSGMFDLIFLIIYMKESHEMDIAVKILEIDNLCDIIFVTMDGERSSEQRRLESVYYMLKPICDQDIENTLRLCRRDMFESNRYIEVMVNRESIRIQKKHIIYIEILNRAALIHTSNHTYKTYSKLKQIENELGGFPFLRCHRGFLVNMNFIQNIERFDFIVTSGDKVPIRKNGSSKIKETFTFFKTCAQFKT